MIFARIRNPSPGMAVLSVSVLKTKSEAKLTTLLLTNRTPKSEGKEEEKWGWRWFLYMIPQPTVPHGEWERDRSHNGTLVS